MENLGIYKMNDTNVEFRYKTKLGVLEKDLFVENVMSYICPSQGVYKHILRDFYFKMVMIAMYTDIQMNNKNLKEIEDLIANSDIIEFLESRISADELEEIKKAISYAIEAWCGVKENNILDSISSVIKGIEKTVSNIGENDFGNFMKKFSEMDLDAKTIVDEYFKNKNFEKEFDKIEKAKKTVGD